MAVNHDLLDKFAQEFDDLKIHMPSPKNAETLHSNNTYKKTQRYED